MRKRKKSIEAFSLVEVTIALGVVVFCLVSVFGLLATGLNVTQTASIQTSATHVLTAIASDIQSAPKSTSLTTTTLYLIKLPAPGAGATSQQVLQYIGEDGLLTNTVSGARYQMNVWATESSATRQETLIRVVLSWPPAAAFATAQGSVESVIAVNRTP